MIREYKWFKIVLIVFNVIGLMCLLYFSIPYIRHDMSITNPNSMLSSYSFDTCGFILTIGFIPLLVSNILAFKFIKIKKFNFLFFIPSIICFGIVSHYLFIDSDFSNSNVSEPLMVVKCSVNGKKYTYSIYQEDNGEYSLGMDDNDNLDLSVIEYDDIDTIINSLEEYYKDIGGMCP